MQLYFTPRSKRPLSTRARFILAILTLVLALCVVGGWLAFNYYAEQSRQPDDTDETSSTPMEIVYTAEDTKNLLFILSDDRMTHFVLLQSAPKDNRLTAVTIPATLQTKKGISLADTHKKHGAARAASAVAEVLELSVHHYLQFSGTQIDTFLNHLKDGIPFTLPEKVRYTDDNGATQRLDKGSITLSPTQTVGLLHYNEWKTAAGDTVSAALLTSLLNKYLLPDRYFSGDFSTLSNNCVTNIRISDFSNERSALEYMAKSNSHAIATNGTGICQQISLPGSQSKGLFVPDLKRCRKETPLY